MKWFTYMNAKETENWCTHLAHTLLIGLESHLQRSLIIEWEKKWVNEKVIKVSKSSYYLLHLIIWFSYPLCISSHNAGWFMFKFGRMMCQLWKFGELFTSDSSSILDQSISFLFRLWNFGFNSRPRPSWQY